MRFLPFLLLLAGCVTATPEQAIIEKLTPAKINLRVKPSIRLAAYATPPDRITITQGLIEYTEGDELPFAISHELAHLTLNHNPNLDRNGQYEREADVVGMCEMDKAGYDWRAGVSLLTKFRDTFPTEMTDRLDFIETMDLGDYC